MNDENGVIKIPKNVLDEQSELVTLKIPKQVLEFAEFYAELGNKECDELLTKILIDRLKEIKTQIQNLPYLDIPELL